MATTSTPERRKLFVRKLLAWYRRAARDLPWRATRNPYAILVSEFMLQQTQVSRVVDFYPRFLKRFPTIAALARARPKAVMEQWDGLGYYARARNLHKLAKQLSATGYQVPADPAALTELPGVGRYTAGAVACFAYEQPVPAVDTNVKRVLGRVFRKKDVWGLATAIVPKNGKTAWKLNQALMELGRVGVRGAKTEMPGVPRAARVPQRTMRRRMYPICLSGGPIVSRYSPGAGGVNSTS